MGHILFRFARVLLSSGYCFFLGLVIMLFTDLSFSSGVFIGAFFMLVIGFASMTGNRRTIPLAHMGLGSRTIDASSIRINAGINTEVAKVEQELALKKISRHMERPDFWLDLFVKRLGLELIIAGMIAGIIAFIPYINYFTS